MSAAIAVDLVVAALLVATCAYCAALNRRLKSVKSGQAALTAAIAAFDESARRAEAGLARIETDGLAAGRDVDEATARATALLGELSVMLTAGDRIAGRIEGAVNDARALGPRSARAGGPP